MHETKNCIGGDALLCGVRARGDDGGGGGGAVARGHLGAYFTYVHTCVGCAVDVAAKVSRFVCG